MPNATPAWTHPAIYGAVRAAVAALQFFPVDQNLRTMRAVGALWARAPFNRHRLQRAIDNIAWCFPEWSPEQVRRTAVDAYRRLFALAVEVGASPRLITPGAWAERVRIGETSRAILHLLHHKPAILISGHCGNWEVLGYALATLGFPMHAVYRPLDLKPLDRWVRETRALRGIELLDKFGAAHKAPIILGRGEPLGFTADQNAGDRGVFVPFFNRLASTYKSIGLLAMRFDAPVICGQARCVGRFDAAHPQPLDAQDFHYEIDLVDYIDPADWASQPDPLYYITARYRRAIETMVRRAPEQYLWMHRYWKSRPQHERQGKPFPDRLREKIAALPWTTPESLECVVARSEIDAAACAASPAPRPAERDDDGF